MSTSVSRLLSPLRMMSFWNEIGRLPLQSSAIESFPKHRLWAGLEPFLNLTTAQNIDVSSQTQASFRQEIRKIKGKVRPLRLFQRGEISRHLCLPFLLLLFSRLFYFLLLFCLTPQWKALAFSFFISTTQQKRAEDENTLKILHITTSLKRQQWSRDFVINLRHSVQTVDEKKNAPSIVDWDGRC